VGIGIIAVSPPIGRPMFLKQCAFCVCSSPPPLSPLSFSPNVFPMLFQCERAHESIYINLIDFHRKLFTWIEPRGSSCTHWRLVTHRVSVLFSTKSFQFTLIRNLNAICEFDYSINFFNNLKLNWSWKFFSNWRIWVQTHFFEFGIFEFVRNCWDVKLECW